MTKFLVRNNIVFIYKRKLVKICIDALSNYLSPYIDYLYSLTSEKNRITVRWNRSINSYTHENCAIHLSRRQRKVINRFLWKIYVFIFKIMLFKSLQISQFMDTYQQSQDNLNFGLLQNLQNIFYHLLNFLFATDAYCIFSNNYTIRLFS